MSFRVRAVTYPLQVFNPIGFDSVGRAPVSAAVDRLPVGPRYTGQVERSLHAAFDFEGTYSKACECDDVFKQAQIFRIEDISSTPILLYRKNLTGAFFLDKPPGPSARLSAKTAVCTPVPPFLQRGTWEICFPIFQRGAGGI